MAVNLEEGGLAEDLLRGTDISIGTFNKGLSICQGSLSWRPMHGLSGAIGLA